jgi:multicomponent Na+:H+ antiporter subunit C
MTTSFALVVTMAALYAAGVYAMLERSLTRVLIGFLLLGNATNLLLLTVMGYPGVSPFHGDEGRQSDPLPQALMLTAIVITFAVSAFLLALIYRSWQLGRADTVEDDESDVSLRAVAIETEDALEAEEEDAETGDESVTDFVGVDASPITLLHAVDAPALDDDAPVDRPRRGRADRDHRGDPTP